MHYYMLSVIIFFTPAAWSVSARLSKPVYCACLPQEAQRKINGLMNSVFDEYEQYSR